MTHQKPEPIVLSGGDIVFARAHPYRPPTARQPHWSWRMTTVKSGQGWVPGDSMMFPIPDRPACGSTRRSGHRGLRGVSPVSLEGYTIGMAESHEARKFFKPSMEDWVVVVSSALFCISGVTIFRQSPIGAASATFLGGCFLVGVWSLRTKQKTSGQASPVNLGQMYWTRKSFVAPAGLAVFGAVCGWAFAELNPLLQWMAYGCAVVGLGMGVLTLANVLPERYLQLTSEGLYMGSQRERFLLHWDNVAGVAVGNPCSARWNRRSRSHTGDPQPRGFSPPDPSV